MPTVLVLKMEKNCNQHKWWPGLKLDGTKSFFAAGLKSFIWLYQFTSLEN